jgi:hypothetical protein
MAVKPEASLLRPICECGPNRRIIAVLGGTPGDRVAWEKVQAGATAAIERLARRIKATETPGDDGNRRGNFNAVAFGISYGNGLKVDAWRLLIE